MFEELNKLETGIIKCEEVKDLLEILEQDYFDRQLTNEKLIVYNYTCFHKEYATLLNVAIEKLHNSLEELKNSFEEIWKNEK